MMVSKERRRYPRFTKQFKAHCITTESKRGGDDCTVINVSLKGLGVVFNTSEEIKVGSSVILEIPASEEHEPHTVKGVVKWVKKRENDYIKFKDTLGFIGRQPNGKFLCFVNKLYIGEEPNKYYAKKRVEEMVILNEEKNERP